VELWTQVFRVLKPGGYLLAFSAPRTYHHLATNLEGVGFEIRDQVMWLFASGFPKAQDMGRLISKQQGKAIPQRFLKNSESIKSAEQQTEGAATRQCAKCETKLGASLNCDDAE
jgi:DNA modification methylase